MITSTTLSVECYENVILDLESRKDDVDEAIKAIRELIEFWTSVRAGSQMAIDFEQCTCRETITREQAIRK